MVITVLVVFTVACAVLFAIQRSLIYYPQPRSNRGGSVLMTLPVGTSTIQVSTRPHVGADAVIYFGGNAEDVSQDVPELADAFPGRAIFALHYPGYGGSSGSPTEKDIFAAARALFDQVQAVHPNVVIIGRSLGSGVATWLASKENIERLVLITPFDSLGDVASEQFRFLPVRWLLLDKFDSGRYAPAVKAPTWIITAGDDELVPRFSSDRLRTRFREGLASYVIVPGFGHNDIQDSPEYWTLLSRE